MEITIEANISEQDFIESCLNMKHSGSDPIFHLVIYAFAKSWHIDKLTYYKELLEER